tara:strand:+ start:3337 stop:4968 length:1632 start_codon:yes stop_codon:yes gene_type:complete
MPESKILSVVKQFKRGVCKITCQSLEISSTTPFHTTSDELVAGTGFLIPSRYLYLPDKTEEGEKCYYFVTNAHVVEGCASKRIQVEFPFLGSTKLYGETVIACHELDFAIVCLTPKWNGFLEQQLGSNFADTMKQIPPLRPNSKVLNTTKEAYHSCATIGYPLDSSDAHLACGKISGKAEHYLQLNSSISSGNSGGPLFNEAGQVIGITSANYEDSEGISLAIPWSAISTMLLHYKEETDFVLVTPHLGLAAENLIHAYCVTVLKAKAKGALVKTVFDQSPLKAKGLRKGDIITTIGDCNSEYEIDSRCLVQTPYQCDKVHFCSLNFCMLLDRQTTYIDIWRKGKTRRLEFQLSNSVGRVRALMPAIESISYTIFCGMVFSDLCANHLEDVEDSSDPAIVSFLNKTHMAKHACVLTAFQTPCSVLQQGYETLKTMTIIKAINKTDINSVEELCKVLRRLLKRFVKDPQNQKARFITMHSHADSFIVDLFLAFQIEPLLAATPGFPAEDSLLNEHLVDFASKFNEISLLEASSKGKKRKRGQSF